MDLAVDAFNLRADRRGMGRYVRAILSGLAESGEVGLTLVVRSERDASALRDVGYGPAISLREARRRRFDATWYPWNAMRFELPGARTAVTVYDAFAFTEASPNPVGRWREQRPIRRAIRRADILTTISRWSAEEIARVFAIDSGRFDIIAPVPSDFWQPVTPVTRDPYILFVAGPEERKNAGLLFAAFERAFPARDVTLVVAGTLRASDEASLAKAGIAARREHPDDVALRALYCGALAVAVPSRAEGYGLMAVEAMACGAAVIAAQAAALPEACDGAALLVEPGDAEAWSEALGRVASQKRLRSDLQRRSLERAARMDRLRPANDFAALLRRHFSSAR